jgi:hypothetical protein
MSLGRADGWNDRIWSLLRNVLLALPHLPECKLADVLSLLDAKSTRSEQFRSAFLTAIEDPNLLKFWRQDFVRFEVDEGGLLRNRLRRLLLLGNVGLMFSQPDNLIDIKSLYG